MYPLGANGSVMQLSVVESARGRAMSRMLVSLILAAAGFLALAASPAYASVSPGSISLSGTITAGTAYSGVTATFGDSSPTETVGQLKGATINWGDGSSSAGTITGGNGSFSVTGVHTYANPASVTITVSLSNGSGTVTDPAASATVYKVPPIIVAAKLNAATTSFKNYSVGTFTAADTDAASDFAATIDWGDGTVSPAIVLSQTTPGTFAVSGSHAYLSAGPYNVVATIVDNAPVSTPPPTPPSVGTGDALVGVVDQLAPTAGAAFNGEVAEFRDADATTEPAGFHATISWGDGSTTAGTVGGANGSFSVNDAHTYVQPGSYPVIVTLSGNGSNTASATATRTETVADAMITGTGYAIAASGRKRFSGTVALFTDANPYAKAADFSSTIDWGDGRTSTGKVVATRTGTAFDVTGSHVYGRVGAYLITVAVTDAGGSSLTTIAGAIDSAAHLSLSLSATPTPAMAGSKLKYLVMVKNRGPSAATSVTLSDLLPTRLRLQGLTAHGLRCRPARRSREIVCDVASLRNRGSAWLMIAATIAKGHGGRLTDSASVASRVFDPNRSDDHAKVTTRIL